MPLTLSGSNGVSGIDGTVSSPAIQGGDSNTGTFYPAADTVAWATNGTERGRVSSDGTFRVKGAGTAGSTDALQISGSAPASAMTLDSSGLLMLGTTSLLTGSPRLNVVSTGSYTATLVQNDNSDRTLMRLENKWATSSNNSTMIQFVDAAGNERGTIKTSTTATSYATSSDYRLKENIQPMSEALSKVSALNPVIFNWKVDGSEGQGFIAHELQAIVPDAVTGEKDAVDAEGNPRYQGVDTSFLVATLTAAIQELSSKLDALEAKVNGTNP